MTTVNLLKLLCYNIYINKGTKFSFTYLNYYINQGIELEKDKEFLKGDVNYKELF